MADVNGGPARPTTRIEFALVVMMSLAAVGTAWAGFQSSQWGGVQTDTYAEASAIRTDSIQANAEAGQERVFDVVTFGSWLNALDDELLLDPTLDPGEIYEPGEDTVDGFVFVRFRDEFQPAMDAWLELEPFENEDAPATPFELPEYRLAAAEQAHVLHDEADELAATAHLAGQRGTDYVLTAVIFALVLFFGGVASRTPGRGAQHLLFWFALAVLVFGGILLLLMPVSF